PADQGVGADAQADRGFGADAAIVAVERARPQVGGGREDGPGDGRLLGDADVEAELGDGAVVELVAAGLVEAAAQVLGRADNEPGAATHRAGEHADLDARLRLRLGARR